MTSDVFQGKIEGFAEISVDYFLGRSLHCSTFFLSHCHTDHIKGLDSQEFKSLLQQKQVKIYCTHITASLVLKRSKLEYLASSFIHLEKDESYTLHVSHDETVNVTLLDANHCPGSVMFLFSKDGCNALYTGDFRVNKYLAINDAIKDVQLNYLYIDTTFFSPKIPIFHNFPSREESEDAVVRFVLREKEKNDSVEVHIDVTPGWENIFIALGNHFECDIQAMENLYSQYEDIENILFYLTLKKSWIHINQTNSECPLCSVDTLKLRPSIQWKLHNNMLSNDAMIAAKAGAQKTWYVTHSMHSSYSECCSFIEQVSADKVFPIATPPKSSNEEIISQLKKFWKKNPLMIPNKLSNTNSIPFNLLKNKENVCRPCEEIFDTDNISCESDDCPSPILLAETKQVLKIGAIEKDIDLCMKKTHRRENDFKACPKKSVKSNLLSCSHEIPQDMQIIHDSPDTMKKHHPGKKRRLKKNLEEKKLTRICLISSESDDDSVKMAGTATIFNESVTHKSMSNQLVDNRSQSDYLTMNVCKPNPYLPEEELGNPQDLPNHRTNLSLPSDHDAEPHQLSHEMKFLDVDRALGPCSAEEETMDRIMSQYFGFDSD